MTLPDDDTMCVLQAIEDSLEAGNLGWTLTPGGEVVLYIPEGLWGDCNCIAFPLEVQSALEERGWIVMEEADGIAITEQGRYALDRWRKKNKFEVAKKVPPRVATVRRKAFGRKVH